MNQSHMKYRGVLAAAVVALSACTTGTDVSGGDGAKATTDIAFVNAAPSAEFSISLECGAREAVAAQPGLSLNYQASKQWDATEQRSVLDSALATKPAALLVVPTDPTALQKPLETAAASGIKIVLLDTSVDDPSFSVSSISTDNLAAGATAFDGIKLRHSGGKVMAIATAPGIKSNDDRVAGFERAVKNDPAFQYTGVQYNPEFTVTKAAQIVAAALQKDPDIVGIFAANSTITEGVVAGIKQVGAQGKVGTVGFDPTPSTAKLIKDGAVDALVAQEPYTIGQEGVVQAVAALAGKPTERTINSTTFLLTKDNIDGEGAKFVYKTSC